jgi:hypothetical protein
LAVRSRWFVGSSRRRQFDGSSSSFASARPAPLAARQHPGALLDRVAGEEERAEERPHVRRGLDVRDRHHLFERRAPGIEHLAWSCAK